MRMLVAARTDIKLNCGYSSFNVHENLGGRCIASVERVS